MEDQVGVRNCSKSEHLEALDLKNKQNMSENGMTVIFADRCGHRGVEEGGGGELSFKIW